ncbi:MULTISPECIES: hypothetical protein [Streptomyces]|uniref:hypothetical protein n=1 Tax=Streptomyces TaxID=1883 RepID=UPI0004CD3625|nr:MULTISPECIES: hypothetical protein [Streptomyces]
MSRKAIPAEAFEHGDPRRYRRGCHCRPCTKGASADARRRRYLRANGRGTLHAPDRAAAHITRLRDAGMQDLHICKDARISPATLYDIMRGQRRVHYAVEARILRVTVPSAQEGRSGSHIDACGTRRRLRALAAEGWPAAELARRIGRDKQYVVYLQLGHGGGTVRRWVANYVHDLYERLNGLKPEQEGVRPALARATRDRAAAKGWLGTGYWDIDEIDDPDFEPASGEPRSRNELAALRRTEVEHLLRFNLSEHEIAARLDMAYSTVRNIALEIHTGKRRIRPPEGAKATPYLAEDRAVA